MPRIINKSSPKMNETNNSVSKYDFPWDDIEIGFSFGVEDNEISLSYLRSMATQKGNQLSKKFKVVDHGPLEKPRYEVGRLEYIKPEPSKSVYNKAQLDYLQELICNGQPPWDGSLTTEQKLHLKSLEDSEVARLPDSVGIKEPNKANFFEGE